MPMTQLFVIFSFLLWAIALLGIGSFLNIAVSKYFKSCAITNEIKILYYSILGFIFVSTVGTIFNFFIPLGQLFSIAILLLGIILSYVRQKDIFTFSNRWEILMLAMLAFFCGLFSLMNLKNYDTGLYHLPMINWITTNALPFGLANLHSRFGFNSSWFIDASIVYPLRAITVHPFFIINSILFFSYGTFIFFTLSKVIRKNKLNISSLFTLFTFIPWFHCMTTSISSPEPDFPTMIMTLFITFMLIRYLEVNNLDYLLITFIISFYVVTIKLSAAPYFFEIFLALAVFWALKKISLKKIIPVTTIILIIGLPFLARGLVTSGYPAFPSTIGRMNFSWSVPRNSATTTAAWIESWARKPNKTPDQVLSNWHWLVPWFQKTFHSEALWFKLLTIGLALSLFSFVLKKKNVGRIFLIIFLMSSLGCSFWFFSAPDPRFGYGYLYSFSGIILSYGIYNLLTYKKHIAIFSRLVAVLFVLLMLFHNRIYLSEIKKLNKAGRVKLIAHETIDGATVFTPKKGDQCFDAPLFCAPSFNKNLRITFDKSGHALEFSINK